MGYGGILQNDNGTTRQHEIWLLLLAIALLAPCAPILYYIEQGHKHQGGPGRQCLEFSKDIK